MRVLRAAGVGELDQEGEGGLDRVVLEEGFVLPADILQRLRGKGADRDFRGEYPTHLVNQAGPPCCLG